MNKQREETLGMGDLVRLCGVSDWTIRNWIGQGKLPKPQYDGNKPFWFKKDCESFMKWCKFWRPVATKERMLQADGGTKAGAGMAAVADMKASADYTHAFHHNPLHMHNHNQEDK